VTAANVRTDVSLWTDYDTFLFKQGRHFRLYEKLGAHYLPDRRGTYFAVWAPNAERVSVIGDFNGWDPRGHALGARWDGTGVWEGFVESVQPGTRYKYHIQSRVGGYVTDRADPVGFFAEEPPATASVVWHQRHSWQDGIWMENRARANALDAPWSVYEVHLGSWRRQNGHWMGYARLGEELSAYCRQMGFTHVEFLPVMEHPFYGSWGYQTTGYFAPTARYGNPDEFATMVDIFHQAGIGVILDWVPSHFPTDDHALAFFDGTHLYEHADPRKGFHPDWKSAIFNYGRFEVVSFLISSALFWLDRFHVDGLRVDAVASMLYLDYSRQEGEWLPNEQGGRENLEAIVFLQNLNEQVYAEYPDVQTIAEESTAWPKVSRPTDMGGLGFGFKWNMGWMHDILEYMAKDPVHRKHHHNELTFSFLYGFDENFMLSLSHDEVVYGKRSLVDKMPGDRWQKMANLRLLLGYQAVHPGKQLLFMGGEFAQWAEWNHDQSLDWHLIEESDHEAMQRWLADVNRLYRSEPALWKRDFTPDGFEWVVGDDADQSVLLFLRKAGQEDEPILVAANFTPVVRYGYLVGVDRPGRWRELLNSDAEIYGGSGVGNQGSVVTEDREAQGKPYSLALTLPPLAILLLKPDSRSREAGR